MTCKCVQSTNDGGKLVTITAAAHERLLWAEKFLCELEAEGADNWDGYHRAYLAAAGEDEEA